MSRKLRIGIIGAGGICEGIHLPSIAATGLYDIAWICDIIESKAKNAADKHNIPRYGDNYRKLLSEDCPEAVFVLVQPDQAFRIAYDCMTAGCHVFVEKPMGITSYQAETLLGVSVNKGVQCQIGFNRRFIPLVKKTVEKIKGLGAVYQVDGFFFKNSDAAFYDGCSSAFTCDVVHTVDIVRHIAGSEAKTAFQMSAKYGNSRVDNAWNALLAFENGVTGTVRSNYASGGRVHGIIIHGEAASAYINIGFGSEPGFAKILYCGEKSFSRASVGIGRQDTEITDIADAAGSSEYYRYYGYFDEDRLFAEAILNGTEVPCGAGDAVKTMRLLDMMRSNEISV